MRSPVLVRHPLMSHWQSLPQQSSVSRSEFLLTDIVAGVVVGIGTTAVFRLPCSERSSPGDDFPWPAGKCSYSPVFVAAAG